MTYFTVHFWLWMTEDPFSTAFKRDKLWQEPEVKFLVPDWGDIDYILALQGVTKRCRLSWLISSWKILTHSLNIYSKKSNFHKNKKKGYNRYPISWIQWYGQKTISRPLIKMTMNLGSGTHLSRLWLTTTISSSSFSSDFGIPLKNQAPDFFHTSLHIIGQEWS